MHKISTIRTGNTPLAATGRETNKMEHPTLHNIYWILIEISNLCKNKCLRRLTESAMLTSLTFRGGLNEVRQAHYNKEGGLSSGIAGVLPVSRGCKAGASGNGLSYAGQGKAAEGNKSGSAGTVKINIRSGIIQAVAGKSGYQREMLGNRRGFWSADGDGPREQHRFYETLRKFYDIFDEEGRIENQGEAGAYAAGYAGGAICECGEAM